ncbi:MAG: cytochrome c-type biogenesis protein CcmH [Candidatus Mycalebacterium zealandia]|nr:MAG: cytochrome c-type biogenesis protein CcmH [Candidatus Mycalebacterium zealandia]
MRVSTLLFAILFLFAPTASTETVLDRTDTIARQLMCPVCAGQSVAESNSDLARDMRKIIRKKIENGETDEEIILWFQGKYGDTILAEPPLKGFSLVAWFLPVIAAIAGGMVAVLYIRKNARRSRG